MLDASTQATETMSEAQLESLESAPGAESVSFEDAAKTVFGEPAASDSAAESTEVAPASKDSTVEPEADKPVATEVVSPKVAARIAAATRAEMRAQQRRAELASKEQEISQREARLAEQAQRYKLLEEDPVKAFEVLKIDPKSFLEKLAGEQAPENVLAKKVAELEAKLAKSEEERQRETETAKQRADREAIEAAWREASQSFVAHVGEMADKYPHLVAEFTEAEAVAAAERALSEVVDHDDAGRPVSRAEAYRAQFGEYPNDDVIAEYLDEQAKARAEARQKSAWRKRGDTAATASQVATSGDPNPAALPVNRGSSPRTLTSRAASTKATAPKAWSQEAADEESLRILAGAIKS